MKPKRFNLTAEAAEKRREAVKRVSDYLARLRHHDEWLGASLDQIERDLRFLRMEDSEGQGLDYFIGRFERLRELRNMMELGGFYVSLHREMEEAWRRIPQ